MYNMYTLIGRFVSLDGDYVIMKVQQRDGKDACNVKCKILGNLKDNVKQYMLGTGDVMAVKGYITIDFRNNIELVVEKVTFLSSEATQSEGGEQE